MSVYEKLSALNIPLPPMSTPAAAYLPCVRTGGLLYASGHIAKRAERPWVGKLGVNMTTDQGREAARTVAIDLVGTLHACIGDLNRVRRIVKLLVLVNSAPEFTEQHLVANGASEFFSEIFGERGLHARSAFGVTQVPFGSCVEIELIAEVG